MKKLLHALLAGVLAFGMAACADDASPAAESTEPVVETTPETTPETTVETDAETTQEENSEQLTIRLGGLKGPTSIGMVYMLDQSDKDQTANHYEFTMAASASDLAPSLLKGDLDILAVPINLGSTLYNNSEGKVQMAAINTLGVLYIVESGEETITSVTDLKGKTIYATGKGTTPEMALNYLLTENGLDPESDVTIEWKSEPTEIVSELAQAGDEGAVAMLPQPFVTVAKTQLENLNVALDLTEEWDRLGNGSQLLTAGIFVNAAFAEAHPEELAAFLEEYAASTAYANEHVEETAELVEQFDIVKAAIAKQAIPQCNIVCITGEEMKTLTDAYLNVLYEQNPDAIGGSLPEDNFYWNND